MDLLRWQGHGSSDEVKVHTACIPGGERTPQSLKRAREGPFQRAGPAGVGAWRGAEGQMRSAERLRDGPDYPGPGNE